MKIQSFSLLASQELHFPHNRVRVVGDESSAEQFVHPILPLCQDW
ncbi:MAG: hypothetical protein ACO1QB_15315 [Verrucomicrobiales bacterium]